MRRAVAIFEETRLASFEKLCSEAPPIGAGKIRVERCSRETRVSVRASRRPINERAESSPSARHVSRNISSRSIRPAITGCRIGSRCREFRLPSPSRAGPLARATRGNKGCAAAPRSNHKEQRFSSLFPAGHFLGHRR